MWQLLFRMFDLKKLTSQQILKYILKFICQIKLEHGIKCKILDVDTKCKIFVWYDTWTKKYRIFDQHLIYDKKDHQLYSKLRVTVS